MFITQKHKIKKNSRYPLVSCLALCMYWLCTLYTVKGTPHTVQVHYIQYTVQLQCFGSASGPVGSAKFWLIGSGSKEKNINQKTEEKNYSQIWTIEIRENIKISWFLNGSSFSIKISEKKIENSALLKNSVNFMEITWIRIGIHVFQCGSRFRIRIKIKWILSTVYKVNCSLYTVQLDLVNIVYILRANRGG